jgi:spore maturation protein CgeB
VRLFEAAACGTPIISDHWPGLESLFVPGREILLASRGEEVLAVLNDVGEDERLELGARARARILAEHTAAHRAGQLEGYALELLGDTAAAT